MDWFFVDLRGKYIIRSYGLSEGFLRRVRIYVVIFLRCRYKIRIKRSSFFDRLSKEVYL